MNILPWGGPTARAAAALDLQASDVFVPMIPSMIAGIAVVFLFAWHLGILERRRLGGEIDASVVGGDVSGDAGGRSGGRSVGRGSRNGGPRGVVIADQRISTENIRTLVDDHDTAMADTALDPDRATLRPKLLWFNALLTVAVMVLLVVDILPLAYIFMAASAIAILVNFPRVKDQAERVVAHAPSIVGVVSMVLAAGVLIGVLEGTGMVSAMAEWVSASIPSSLGAFSAVITGLLSMPMTFFLSNDAFYFGILPVLAESAATFGVDPVDMARASITGQVVHMQSPLVPAILLLVSLAGVNLGDHHKKVLWRAVIVSLVMLAVAVLIGAVGIG